MNISLEKLKRYGFNKKILTEADFYRICERKKITVIEIDTPRSFYFRALGKDYIVIKKRLKGLKRTFEMFHELAHYFLHIGDEAEGAYFYGLVKCKNELEADVIATIAMIPKNKIGDFEFLEDHPNRFARKIWKDRQKIYFLYGI